MRNIVGFVLISLAVKVAAQDPPDISLVFYLDEKSENGTLVGTIVATDPDMDNTTFSIVSGNETGAFAINPTSGDLTVADEDQMDFDVNPSFMLMVEANDGNGGVTSVYITINLIDLPLGLEEYDKITIYPNPVTDFITITWEGKHIEASEIELYSIGGDLVPVRPERRSGSTWEVDVSSITAGVYFLRIKIEEGAKLNRRIRVR